MPQLIAPLEQLLRSDLRLQLLGRDDITKIKVGFGQIGNDPEMRGYNVGPDQGVLDLRYAPEGTLGGSKVTGLNTFNKLGFTLVVLESGDIYAIHHDGKSLPRDTNYQEVSTIKYLTRLKELCKD